MVEQGWLEEFLDGRRIATLATENEDGSAHLTAVWFLQLGGIIYVTTSGSSRKARNAAARPRGAVIVDARGAGPLCGAAACGALSVLRGKEALAINEQVWRKYLTPAGLASAAVGMAIRASDDVAIRFVADNWRTWSTADDFSGAFEEPGIAYQLD